MVPEAVVPALPKTILVIDDEPEITAILAELLEQEGHRVDTAADGAIGLEMLERRDYDLVLSDTAMPRLGGIDFFRRATEMRPAMSRRTIFLTGDTLSADTLGFLQRLNVPIVTKPFKFADVRRLVREVLARA